MRQTNIPMYRQPAVETPPELLEEGDRFVFNTRKVPCVVEEVSTMDEYDGTIHVVYIVIARGPRGAELWLQRTHTGRLRIKESPPWGPYANVRKLRRVES